MATNKKLITKATALALALDITITTDGLNNEKLSDLVSDLKAKTKDAGLETQADTQVESKGEDNNDGAQDAAEAKAAAEKAKAKAKPPKKPPFSLAKGKAITTKRGILADGAEITANDLAGGEKALMHFVKTGHIIKA